MFTKQIARIQRNTIKYNVTFVPVPAHALGLLSLVMLQWSIPY